MESTASRWRKLWKEMEGDLRGISQAAVASSHFQGWKSKSPQTLGPASLISLLVATLENFSAQLSGHVLGPRLPVTGRVRVPELRMWLHV